MPPISRLRLLAGTLWLVSRSAANLPRTLINSEKQIAAKEAQDGIVHAGSWRGVTWHYDKFPTFMERFEKIEYAFKVSICQSSHH